MNYKKIFKRETKVIAYVVICLTLIVIGTSYAFLLQVEDNTTNQVVSAGNLDITYTQKNGSINASTDDDTNCLMPKSDADGASSGCNIQFSIKNTGSLPMQYDLLIFDTENTANALDHSNIKVTLNKSSDKNLNQNISVLNAKVLNTLTQSSTKRKLESQAIIAVGETVTYSLRVWIKEDAEDTIIGKNVALKVGVEGSVYETGTAAASLLSRMNEGGLAEITDLNAVSPVNAINTMSIMGTPGETGPSVESPSVESAKEYRYIGSEPKNYVQFNGETWRILGIYNVKQEDGSENSRIKIIREKSETMAFDTSGGVDFNNSTIKAYLNDTFYSSLSDTAKQQIAPSTYKLGGPTALDINSKQLYLQEQASDKNAIMNVGLMNASDYTFAGGMDDSVLVNNISSKATTNWLFPKANEWLLDGTDSGIYSIKEDGSISIEGSNTEKNIRPVVYLDSNIKISDGDGTANNPYILEK